MNLIKKRKEKKEETVKNVQFNEETRRKDQYNTQNKIEGGDEHYGELSRLNNKEWVSLQKYLLGKK